MSGEIALSAPAKVNLYLHIVGRRPDGYHELDSMVAFAGLADEVELAEAEDFSLTLDGPFAEALSAGGDNLALRAARALAGRGGPSPRRSGFGRAGGTDRAAAIRIVKNIPIAAGLGGGSADAAAVLEGLARLWGMDEAPFADIAPGLGADVPACLFGRPAFVGGIGEKVAPAPALPEAGLLLVNPGAGLETKDVFAAFDEAGVAESARSRPALDPPPVDVAGLGRALAGTVNDLAAAAAAFAPEIGDVLDAIAGRPGCRLVRMTGSGPTCFGLFDEADVAVAALEEIRAGRPHWWGWAGGFAGGG